MSFDKLPKEILLLIFKFISIEKAYKFFLINTECYNISPSYHEKSLYWSSRCKFYQLIKINCNWKNNFDLNKINIHYKNVEDYYYRSNNCVKKNGKYIIGLSKKRKSVSFSDYFINYLELYDKKNSKLLSHMEKYNV